MSKVSLRDGAGPGSSISLAPETIRVRNALIEKFIGEPLDAMHDFMRMALANETDELRRLGILAARIYILRNRVSNLQEFNRDPSLTSIPQIDTVQMGLNLPNLDDASAAETATDLETDDWSRIQMTEPGEVNGVRFLAGTIIDAHAHDAEKLIKSGKAVRVDEDGNIIDPIETDFDEAGAAPDVDRNATSEDVSEDAGNETVSVIDLPADTAADGDATIDAPADSEDDTAKPVDKDAP
jgi:hypothetical protein